MVQQSSKPSVPSSLEGQSTNVSASAGTDRQTSLPTEHIESNTIFRGRREVTIVHNAESYSLRITRNNKLILTK